MESNIFEGNNPEQKIPQELKEIVGVVKNISELNKDGNQQLREITSKNNNDIQRNFISYINALFPFLPENFQIQGGFEDSLEMSTRDVNSLTMEPVYNYFIPSTLETARIDFKEGELITKSLPTEFVEKQRKDHPDHFKKAQPHESSAPLPELQKSIINTIEWEIIGDIKGKLKSEILANEDLMEEKNKFHKSVKDFKQTIDDKEIELCDLTKEQVIKLTDMVEQKFGRHQLPKFIETPWIDEYHYKESFNNRCLYLPGERKLVVASFKKGFLGEKLDLSKAKNAMPKYWFNLSSDAAGLAQKLIPPKLGYYIH